MSDKIVVIGAGNVAHHLVPALLKAGHEVCQKEANPGLQPQ